TVTAAARPRGFRRAGPRRGVGGRGRVPRTAAVALPALGRLGRFLLPRAGADLVLSDRGGARRRRDRAGRRGGLCRGPRVARRPLFARERGGPRRPRPGPDGCPRDGQVLPGGAAGLGGGGACWGRRRAAAPPVQW